MPFGLQVWTGTFFDDFPVISRSDIATSTEQHVALLFDMLGMKFSKEGKKWVPFNNQMSVLGVVLDTSNFSNGSVFFRRTESRKAELNETLDRRLNEGAIEFHKAPSWPQFPNRNTNSAPNTATAAKNTAGMSPAKCLNEGA